MGEAKKRGTYETRRKEAKPFAPKVSAAERNRLISEAVNSSVGTILGLTVARLMNKK